MDDGVLGRVELARKQREAQGSDSQRNFHINGFHPLAEERGQEFCGEFEFPHGVE